MSRRDKDFFVGYAPTPAADRRFFLRAGLALMAGTAGLATGFAALQTRPGPGQWDQAALRDWTGVVTGQPYGMLRTLDLDGSPRTALLSCLGKCGVAARLNGLEGQAVRIRGSLIARGGHAMIAVPETEMDWITPLGQPADPALDLPEPEILGEIELAGEILDSKCWFGAMRPSSGKGHKACASLCIRGGLPPALFARDNSGRSALMILTSDGLAHGPDLLPLVADPVRVRGTLKRQGDLLLLDAPVSGMVRL
jgi:hypothetical protein